jgi:hypothetical protein
MEIEVRKPVEWNPFEEGFDNLLQRIIAEMDYEED